MTAHNPAILETALTTYTIKRHNLLCILLNSARNKAVSERGKELLKVIDELVKQESQNDPSYVRHMMQYGTFMIAATNTLNALNVPNNTHVNLVPLKISTESIIESLDNRPALGRKFSACASGFLGAVKTAIGLYTAVDMMVLLAAMTTVSLVTAPLVIAASLLATVGAITAVTGIVSMNNNLRFFKNPNSNEKMKLQNAVDAVNNYSKELDNSKAPEFGFRT